METRKNDRKKRLLGSAYGNGDRSTAQSCPVGVSFLKSVSSAFSMDFMAVFGGPTLASSRERTNCRVSKERTGRFSSGYSNSTEEETHQTPSKPIKPHRNPSEPIETHQDPSKPIETHRNPSRPIKTHQDPSNPSKPIQTHQDPSKSQFPQTECTGTVLNYT